jgi:hypothetical protein
MAELNINNYKSTLVLKDEFTINDTSKLKELFIEVLTKTDKLDLKIEGDFKFDAAFMQLFYSAVSAFYELGTKISVYVKDRESFICSCKEYGFINLGPVEIYQAN